MVTHYSDYGARPSTAIASLRVAIGGTSTAQIRDSAKTMQTMSEPQKFREFVRRNIEGIGEDAGFKELSQASVGEGIRHNYAHPRREPPG